MREVALLHRLRRSPLGKLLLEKTVEAISLKSDTSIPLDRQPVRVLRPRSQRFMVLNATDSSDPYRPTTSSLFRHASSDTYRQTSLYQAYFPRPSFSRSSTIWSNACGSDSHCE